MKIYIAMKYTEGDNFENVKAAIDVAEKIAAKGHVPVIPHLFAFWHMIHPHPHGFWMRLDEAMMLSCDAVYWPGHKGGVEAEVKVWNDRGPVYIDLKLVPDHCVPCDNKGWILGVRCLKCNNDGD